MKYLLICCCLFIAGALASEENEMHKIMEGMKDHMEHCKQELDISQDEAENMKNKNIDKELEHKMGCWKACVMQKTGVMDGSTVKLESFEEMFKKVHPDNPDKVTERMAIAEECANKAKDTTEVCEMASEFEDCFKEKISALLKSEGLGKAE